MRTVHPCFQYGYQNDKNQLAPLPHATCPQSQQCAFPQSASPRQTHSRRRASPGTLRRERHCRRHATVARCSPRCGTAAPTSTRGRERLRVPATRQVPVARDEKHSRRDEHRARRFQLGSDLRDGRVACRSRSTTPRSTGVRTHTHTRTAARPDSPAALLTASWGEGRLCPTLCLRNVYVRPLAKFILGPPGLLLPPSPRPLSSGGRPESFVSLQRFSFCGGGGRPSSCAGLIDTQIRRAESIALLPAPSGYVCVSTCARFYSTILGRDRYSLEARRCGTTPKPSLVACAPRRAAHHLPVPACLCVPDSA